MFVGRNNFCIYSENPMNENIFFSIYLTNYNYNFNTTKFSIQLQCCFDCVYITLTVPFLLYRDSVFFGLKTTLGRFLLWLFLFLIAYSLYTYCIWSRRDKRKLVIRKTTFTPAMQYCWEVHLGIRHGNTSF